MTERQKHVLKALFIFT